MNAWSTDGGGGGDIMGATITEATSGKLTAPPLKNGSDLRESGYLIAVGSRTARFRRKHRNTLAVFILLGLLLFLLILAITMTVLYVKLKRHKPLRVCESKECLRSAANLAMSMDRTADPCDDFYQYVCGNWADDHPRPDAYRSYDWFRDKQTKVYTLVRDFLTRNSSSQPRPVMQARDMYAACMDTENLDKRGLQPVTETLEALGLPPYPTFINVTEDFDYSTYTFDWLEAVIKIKVHLGMDVLIGFDIFSDPKNSSTYRLVMGSPETTNPFPSMFNEKKRHKHNGRKRKRPYSIMSRHHKELILNEEYNFESKESDDDDEEEKRKQVSRLFYAELMKQFVVESGASKMTALSETELDQNILLATSDYVQFYTTLYELETDNNTQSDEEYNGKIPEYTIEEIQAHTDSVVENNNGTATPIWKRYLEGIFNVSDVDLNFENDKILISDMDLRYMSLMAALLASTPPVSIELFVWMKVIEVMAVHTTTELRILFANSYDELRGRRPGDSGAPPRSLSCASAVNDMMGMAVSYAIANPHFLNVTKPKIKTMLHEMKNSLARLVGKAKWMDSNTKLATFEKIVQMKSLIGFPDWLLEEGRLEEFYQGIEVDVETHLENMISVIRHKLKSVLNRFRESNNFTWATDPTEVNAYHTFQENTITIPLVMLQYPFYDLGLDSLDYGSLGTVLGHEITHGFDNFGRQFDKRGNLVPWWTNETVESFVNLTHCFIDQYNSFYLPELDEYVDGKRTLGENIADNGGVKEALGALTEHLHKTGPEQKLPGFENMSSEQMFFLSYGNLWCGVSTKESLKAELEDEHSPQEFRARGSLQNNEDFARAWRCPPGSAMNPRHRCIIF